jgi:hypothetical protein
MKDTQLVSTKSLIFSKPVKPFANPIELLFLIITLIFLAEAIIMLLLQMFPVLPRLTKIQGALLDTLLLIMRREIYFLADVPNFKQELSSMHT